MDEQHKLLINLIALTKLTNFLRLKLVERVLYIKMDRLFIVNKLLMYFIIYIGIQLNNSYFLLNNTFLLTFLYTFNEVFSFNHESHL